MDACRKTKRCSGNNERVYIPADIEPTRCGEAHISRRIIQTDIARDHILQSEHDVAYGSIQCSKATRRDDSGLARATTAAREHGSGTCIHGGIDSKTGAGREGHISPAAANDSRDCEAPVQILHSNVSTRRRDGICDKPTCDTVVMFDGKIARSRDAAHST